MFSSLETTLLSTSISLSISSSSSSLSYSSSYSSSLSTTKDACNLASDPLGTSSFKSISSLACFIIYSIASFSGSSFIILLMSSSKLIVESNWFCISWAISKRMSMLSIFSFCYCSLTSTNLDSSYLICSSNCSFISSICWFFCYLYKSNSDCSWIRSMDDEICVVEVSCCLFSSS